VKSLSPFPLRHWMSGGSSLSTTAGPSPLVASRRDRSTDFRTFAGEQDCGYAADPVTRAGDEGYLACKPWHRSLLPDRVSKTPESGGSPCDIVALSKAGRGRSEARHMGFVYPRQLARNSASLIGPHSFLIRDARKLHLNSAEPPPVRPPYRRGPAA